MMDCGQEPTKASILRAHVAAALDYYDSNGDYKDYGIGQIFLSALKHLLRKKMTSCPPKS